MRKQIFKLDVMSLQGKLLESFEFKCSDSFTVAISAEVPDRSPLHEEALNMSDLKVGMNVRRHNINFSGDKARDTALIMGAPFRHDTKYSESYGYSINPWMVPVVTTDYKGLLVQKDWYLADMGVALHEHSDGGGHWNDQNYTLAVN